jgi:hypothetical protein
MDENTTPVPFWAPRFIDALGRSGSARQAAREALVSRGSVYHRKRTDLQFARDWDMAVVRARRARYQPEEPEVPASHTGPAAANWRIRFFQALAETSNVTASAARVRVPVDSVYKLKRDNPRFAARWLAALHEGYDLLEMELLGYLRNPRPASKMDVSGALRVLAAHREAIERRRAMIDEEEEDEQAMLESLDTFLAQMRQRRFANEAILLEAKTADGAE